MLNIFWVSEALPAEIERQAGQNQKHNQGRKKRPDVKLSAVPEGISAARQDPGSLHAQIGQTVAD